MEVSVGEENENFVRVLSVGGSSSDKRKVEVEKEVSPFSTTGGLMEATLQREARFLFAVITATEAVGKAGKLARTVVKGWRIFVVVLAGKFMLTV